MFWFSIDESLFGCELILLASAITTVNYGNYDLLLNSTFYLLSLQIAAISLFIY